MNRPQFLKALAALPFVGWLAPAEAIPEPITPEDVLLGKAGFKSVNLKRIELRWEKIGGDWLMGNNLTIADFPPDTTNSCMFYQPDIYPGDSMKLCIESQLSQFSNGGEWETAFWTCTGRIEHYESPSGRTWKAYMGEHLHE